MVGFWVMLSVVIIALVLVGIAKVLDRIRGIGPDDKWSGWYRGKTNDISQTLGYKCGEYDSMDDYGNRDMDGGLGQ